MRGAAAGWNVVLVSVDTLRADRLNGYGYAVRQTSPAIDDLLGGGVRFANAQASRALTWPSLASVLTGLHPSGHGLISNGYGFREGQPTLATILEAAGYQTGAFLSNMCKAEHAGWSELFCAGGVDKRLNRRAIEWLGGLDPSRPFLLWAHYFGPHPPYYNGGALAREVFDPSYAGFLEPRGRVLDRVMEEGIELTASDRRHLDAIYDAAVAGTDHWIADLLEALATRADLERTLIIFLADHGEDLYQHNDYIYHACSVYQSSLHVPLGFVAAGLLEPGAAVLQNVELVDVLPTVLDLLGLPLTGCLHGSSLLRYLERPDRAGEGKPAMSEYDTTRIATYRQGDFKLISNPDGLVPKCFAGGPDDLYPIDELELYDLAGDPEETTNLAAELPLVVERLLAGLEQHRSSLCGSGPAAPQEVPEELKKELEALGYIAGSG